jgi:hypothetical protein
MHSDFWEGPWPLSRSRLGLLVSCATITLVTLAAGPIGGRGSCREYLMCPGSIAFFGPSAVAVWCILNGACWYLVCLVETSGDLAPSSDDDDAVVVRELAVLAWPRENLAAAAIIHLATKLTNLLDPDLNCFLLPSPCTSLKTTSPSASHPAACFFACLPIAIASHSSIPQPQHHQPPHNLKMKTSIALLAVGASFAFSESISDLPPCGVSLHSLLYALFA